MATVQIGTKAVGSEVKLKVNNVLKSFIIVHQGRPSSLYDTSCDGTWLLMKEIYESRQWHNSNTNDYANSDLEAYLNKAFLNLFDANIKSAIKQVKIPYRAGSGTSQSVTSGANGLSCKIFLLSDREVGYTQSNVNQYIVNDGEKMAYFQDGNGTSEKIAYLNGSAMFWWLRSPCTDGSALTWFVVSNGNAVSNGGTNTYGVRPALVLPYSLLVSDDGSVTTNTAPTTPGAFNLPATINGGSSIAISWGASTDAQGNLAGYKVERSIDGGTTWAQIYQSAGTSCTDNITFGWQTVQYRVKAYDNEGLESGWKASDQMQVHNNTAPTAPPSISVPLSVIGGERLTISWAASTDAESNLAGYRLERKVAAGAWTQIYQGAALSYQDSITKGWTEVTYHVCAYDNAGATNGFTASPTRTVDNNTAPTIACSSSGDIGEKAAGFTVSYTISDADGDAVTVAEAIDGTQKRSFAATLGAANSFAVTGEYFMCLLNGQHTMTVTATDAGGKSTVLTLTFTKAVHRLRITMEVPDVPEPDQLITKTVLNITRDIPSDATFTVKVTNNAKDAKPVWEDATSSVMSGINYLFENTTIANGNAYAFEIIAERGAGGEGGFIKTIGGAFE